ncbi:MAG: tetratricopeptide repeat protein [Nitrososphaera sp.]
MLRAIESSGVTDRAGLGRRWNENSTLAMAARIEGVNDSADGEIHMKKIIISSLIIVALLIGGVGFHYLNRSIGDDSLVNPGESVLRKTGLTVTEITKRAENGDARMQYNLAQIYGSGDGVKIDHEKAAHWSLKAAEQGIADAQTIIGVSYMTGAGVRLDWRTGFRWLEKAALQGQSLAQMLLGVAYLGDVSNSPPDFRIDYGAAFYWTLKSAQNGYIPAQAVISRMYRAGIGTGVDNREAVNWLKKAAQNGWPESMRELAKAYEEGSMGFEKDLHEAREWQKKADRTK